MNIPRRRFLKFVTFGTATSLVGGQWWQREVLAYCTPPGGEIVKTGVFQVRLSDYPALLAAWGSVRLGINPVRPDVEPFPDGAFYPFLINRDDSGNYYVLDCECRHASCVVPPFDNITEMGIRCPCHGSLYWIDGQVIGGPADSDLHSYPFELDGQGVMTIHIPCWGFDVQAAVLPGGPNARIRIDFTAKDNVTYEVSFRQKLTDPWAPALFATTPTGPADQSSLTTFESDVSVYLERPTATGFFAVSMKLSEV